MGKRIIRCSKECKRYHIRVCKWVSLNSWRHFALDCRSLSVSVSGERGNDIDIVASDSGAHC